MNCFESLLISCQNSYHQQKISLFWVLTWPAIAVSSEIWVLVLGVGFGGWVLAVGAFCSQQPQRKQANRAGNSQERRLGAGFGC